jgi:small subunit ribosomal protein S13
MIRGCSRGRPGPGLEASNFWRNNLAEETEELKHIVRILNTDLNGHQPVQMALTGIKGMGRRNARLLTQKAELDPTETIGMLSDEAIAKLREIVESAQDHLPIWMKNRRKDLLTGEDRHVMGIDLMLTQREEMDIIRKTRSYRGIRHERGLRVRGQKTRSTGRRGATVGVSRKKK